MGRWQRPLAYSPIFRGTPDKTKLEYWEAGTIPWLNSGAVNDRLITQRAIDLLQERRTALIAAAVTGQIDVREVV